MSLFVEKADEYLEEMIRLEGTGNAADQMKCCLCCLPLDGPGSLFYRCEDCPPTSIWCERCLVDAHRRNYTHRVEVCSSFLQWAHSSDSPQVFKDHFFARTSLKALGLRVQLGHCDLEPCTNPIAAYDDSFVVIDILGIHNIGLDFCGCHRGITRTRQLLRARLFPATTIDPRTACTFRVLEHFQMSSFTGKVSAYEYLVCLYRLTDNTWNLTPSGRSESCGGTRLVVSPSLVFPM